jgi:hypothetical protein
MKIENKTVVIGDEYDVLRRQKLISVLKSLNSSISAADWGLGGSQEIETLVVQIEGNEVTVESETYVGLTISGKAELVDRIASLVESL